MGCLQEQNSIRDQYGAAPSYPEIETWCTITALVTHTAVGAMQ